MNKILVLLVFSHQHSPYTWSLPCLMSRTHFKQSVEKIDSLISTSEGSELVKLKTKTGLAEEGDITIRGPTSRIHIFRVNRGTWFMNFTRRSPVQRTYNTEPSPKALAWGRNTPMYPGKYSFPFSFSFSFF
jgi:hypothetical protein